MKVYVVQRTKDNVVIDVLFRKENAERYTNKYPGSYYIQEHNVVDSMSA